MDEQKQGMKYGVYEGISASMMFGITNTYLTVFALALGASNLEIGMIVAVPAILAMFAYIPAAYFIEGSNARNKLCAITALLGRGMWLFAALVPVFATGRLFWLLAFVSLSYLFESFVGPSWASLMGDIVPDAHRGAYFGRRNMLCRIAALLVVVISGFVLDIYTGLGGFTIIFAAAGIFGLLTVFFFSRFPEFKYRKRGHIKLSADIRGVIDNKMFKRFVIIACIWQFGVSISSPFFNVYLVNGMGAAYQWIAYLSLVSGIAAIIVQRGWGSMSDRFSHRSILIISAIGASLVPFFWMFAPSPEFVIPINILSGISWAGFEIAAFNYLLEATRGKERALYSAVYWSALGLPAIFGPIIGGMMIDTFAAVALSLNNFTSMFLVSWIIRLSAAVLFLKFLLELPDKRVYSARYVTGEMVVIGFSHVWRSFHLIKETSSIPVRLIERVEKIFRKSIR